MKHDANCPITLTTETNKTGTILIIQKCPCYTAPTWNNKGVK